MTTPNLPALEPIGIRSIPSGARLVPVIGDTLEPHHRPGDALFVVPVDRYIGEDLYAIELFPGAIEFVHAVRFKPSGPFHLSRPNARYSSFDISEEQFAKIAVGLVIASCRMMDSRFFH